jgi:hypothetical protein
LFEDITGELKMKTVLLEIRDRNTCIPALAIEPDQHAIFRRAGYGPQDQVKCIILIRMGGDDYLKGFHDPYQWYTRTMHHAHLWIEQHFDTLKDGDVIDVQVILGETTIPKQAECV